jgi:hypothetical protein
MFWTKRIIPRNGKLFLLTLLVLLISICQCLPQLQGAIRVNDNNFRIQGNSENSNRNQIPRGNPSNGEERNLIGQFRPSDFGNELLRIPGPESGRWEGHYFTNGKKQNFHMDIDFFESGVIKGNGRLQNGNTFQVGGRLDKNTFQLTGRLDIMRVTINAIYNKFDQVDSYIGEIDGGIINGRRQGSYKISNGEILNFYDDGDQSFSLSYVTDNVALPVGERQQQRSPLINPSLNVGTPEQANRRPAQQARPTPRLQRPPRIILPAIPISTKFTGPEFDVRGKTFISGRVLPNKNDALPDFGRPRPPSSGNKNRNQNRITSRKPSIRNPKNSNLGPGLRSQFPVFSQFDLILKATEKLRSNDINQNAILPIGNVNAGVLPLAIESTEDQKLAFFPPFNKPNSFFDSFIPEMERRPK